MAKDDVRGSGSSTGASKAYGRKPTSFVKGVNLGPAHLDVAATADAAVRRDVGLAREAGLDMIRCRGHIAPAALYAAADELGMLVWQDMPLVGGYARAVRRQAVEQATAIGVQPG